MPGKQAKILSADQINDLLVYASLTRWPKRNRVIVLLSTKAGFRASEIANLTWDMVLDATGAVAASIELRDHAAKYGSGRAIPMNAGLRSALIDLRPRLATTAAHVVRSERDHRMRAGAIVNWFRTAFAAIGLNGCSSHSGRRTFITRAARLVHRTGGSLRDVQMLAGHSSIQTTQGYIDGDSDAQRKLMALI